MSSSRRSGLLTRILWTPEQLESDRQEAISIFRVERMQEPLEEYLDHFDDAQDIMDELIESTVDLADLEAQAPSIVSNRAMLEGLRSMAGPPISADDLKILVDSTLSAQAIREDPDLPLRVTATIRAGLDRRRFPWVSEQREPSSEERIVAVIATAAMIAARRTQTSRRNEGKERQEALVRQTLLDGGFTEVTIPSSVISTVSEAPRPGQFCREVIFGDRKADIVVGLWDHRHMPIECKVSNSATNSIKRLNNDAAVKAVHWILAFGERQVVPVATLSGVYRLLNLKQAQEQGLTIYWAHRLSDLTEWIDATKGPWRRI